MKSTIQFIRTDHGPAIRQAVGVLAVAVAMTCTLGYLTGQWVHNLNDSMAGFRLDTAALFQSAPPVRPVPTMVQQRHAAATLPTLQAPPLADLTVAELRKLARSQGHGKLARSGRRADLLQVLA